MSTPPPPIERNALDHLIDRIIRAERRADASEVSLSQASESLTLLQDANRRLRSEGEARQAHVTQLQARYDHAMRELEAAKYMGAEAVTARDAAAARAASYRLQLEMLWNAADKAYESPDSAPRLSKVLGDIDNEHLFSIPF